MAPRALVYPPLHPSADSDDDRLQPRDNHQAFTKLQSAGAVELRNRHIYVKDIESWTCCSL